MKSLILIIMLTLSASVMAKTYTVMPGERKTVTLKTFGAATARAANITGIDGVTATIGRIKNPNEVEINLNASRNAWGGKGKLNVTLAAGVHVKDMYVYSMPRVTIDSPREVIAGQKAKVKLAWVHPDSQMAALNRNNYGYSNIAMQKTGSARYEFDVVTRKNEDQTRTVTLMERNETKEFSIRFRKDPNIPDNLVAPTYPSSEQDKKLSSRNPTRNATVRWNARNGANAYIVSYKKAGQNRFIEFQVNNRTNAVLRNLPVGESEWKVRAIYDPSLSGSTLDRVTSPYTVPAKITITQNSVQNKLKHRKKRG